MRILVSGSSGLIGTALVTRLRVAGHDVVSLVRRQAGAGELRWDPAAGQQLPDDALDRVDAVVNLAGAGIGDHRWTDDYKRTLVASRLEGTELLAASIGAATNPPAVFVSASAVGYYGNRGDEVLDERSPAGSGFLADLCVRWERAAAAARSAATKVATVRTGIVLTPKGGALRKQLPLFKLGLGGRFGDGRQWQSWITLDDEVGAIAHLLDHPADGAFNLTAPNPATNADMAKALGRALHRPAVLPIPAFGPKLLLGGELADALLFSGQRVVPAALQSSGYEFQHPELAGALDAMFSSP
ncbi:MAG: TIGR01777 family oxidoreductase [Ilumatobacteraceae bacterium]